MGERLLDALVWQMQNLHPGTKFCKKGLAKYEIHGRLVHLTTITGPCGLPELVVLDGPLRQPLRDYLVGSQRNEAWPEVPVVQSALHGLPPSERISFEEVFPEDRTEAMEVAVMEAEAREQHAKDKLTSREQQAVRAPSLAEAPAPQFGLPSLLGLVTPPKAVMLPPRAGASAVALAPQRAGRCLVPPRAAPFPAPTCHTFPTAATTPPTRNSSRGSFGSRCPQVPSLAVPKGRCVVHTPGVTVARSITPPCRSFERTVSTSSRHCQDGEIRSRPLSQLPAAHSCASRPLPPLATPSHQSRSPLLATPIAPARDSAALPPGRAGSGLPKRPGRSRSPLTVPGLGLDARRESPAPGACMPHRRPSAVVQDTSGPASRSPAPVQRCASRESGTGPARPWRGRPHPAVLPPDPAPRQAKAAELGCPQGPWEVPGVVAMATACTLPQRASSLPACTRSSSSTPLGSSGQGQVFQQPHPSTPLRTVHGDVSGLVLRQPRLLLGTPRPTAQEAVARQQKSAEGPKLRLALATTRASSHGAVLAFHAATAHTATACRASLHEAGGPGTRAARAPAPQPRGGGPAPEPQPPGSGPAPRGAVAERRYAPGAKGSPPGQPGAGEPQERRVYKPEDSSGGDQDPWPSCRTSTPRLWPRSPTQLADGTDAARQAVPASPEGPRLPLFSQARERICLPGNDADTSMQDSTKTLSPLLGTDLVRDAEAVALEIPESWLLSSPEEEGAAASEARTAHPAQLLPDDDEEAAAEAGLGDDEGGLRALERLEGLRDEFQTLRTEVQQLHQQLQAIRNNTSLWAAGQAEDESAGPTKGLHSEAAATAAGRDGVEAAGTNGPEQLLA